LCLGGVCEADPCFSVTCSDSGVRTALPSHVVCERLTASNIEAVSQHREELHKQLDHAIDRLDFYIRGIAPG
jgi:hypothetical protein